MSRTRNVLHLGVHVVLDLALLLMVAWTFRALVPAVQARLAFGYDIEWMEGATLVSAWRLSQGLGIYGAPAADYIPFIYPPGYPALVAALGALVPFGYGLARAVSLAGSLAAAAALVYAARGLGARWSWSIATGALFLTTWAEGGTFLDLVRIDGLAIGLLGWSLALGVRPSRAHRLAGGVLLALAFMVKHHSAIFGLPLALLLWRRDGVRAALEWGLAAIVPALLFVGAMSALTQGTFLVWLVQVPANHGIVAERFFPWITVESWSPFTMKSGGAPIEVWKALPVAATVGLLLPGWVKGREGAWWAIVGGFALFTVALMRGHTGGFINVLIPGFWAVSLWLVLGATWAARRWPWVAWLVPFALAGQLWEGKDDPTRFIPTAQDTAAAEALIDEIRELPEPVLIPHAPYYAVLAGKQPSFALICLWDIDHAGGPYKRDVRRIDKLLERHHYQSAVLPDDKLGHGLQKHYEKVRTLKKSFGTRTGWGVRLKQVWLPKADAPAP